MATDNQESASSSAAAALAATDGARTQDANTQVTDSSTVTTQDVSAESSAASEQQGAKPQSLLDSVKLALKKDPADGVDADGSKKEESPASKEGKQDAAVSGKDDATKQQDGTQKGQQRHKTAAERVPELLAEVKQLKEDKEVLTKLFEGVDVKEIPAVVAGMRERVAAFDNFSTWVQDSGLNYEQVVSGLSILNLISRGDPAQALKAVAPIYNDLLLRAGEALPTDLQERLDKGEISEPLAKELAKERSKAKHFEANSTARANADTERQQSEAVSTYAKAVESAVTKWESDWKTRDPDYPKKQRFVSLRLRELMQSDQQQLTPQRVVQLADTARTEIENEFKSILPAKTEIKTVTGGASTDAIPQPKNSLAAARAALKGQRVDYQPA